MLLGRNVKVEVKSNKLTIEIDLDVEGELSSTKKNMVIASTGGNVPIATPKGQFNLGLNLYTKPKVSA